MSKFNESEDSGFVSEIVCGIVGVAAAGIVGWLGKKHLPQIKQTKDRLLSAVKTGVEGWKSYPSHEEETLEAQPEEKNPFEDIEETEPTVEVKNPKPVVWIEVVPDTESVNPFITTELPEVPPLANTDKEVEETIKPTPVAPKANPQQSKPQQSKTLLKKCSRNCGSVLQGLDVKAGVCSNCQSKMRCKSCNNQLKKEEWGSALCLPCIQGVQCDECRAITPLGKEVKHAKSCSYFKPTLSEKIVLPSEIAPVEPQEDFLEVLEAEVAETTVEISSTGIGNVPLAVCENCGQMYSGSTCDKCGGTTTVPPKRRTRSKKA